MVDTTDLKSVDLFSRVGSSPTIPKLKKNFLITNLYILTKATTIFAQIKLILKFIKFLEI